MHNKYIYLLIMILVTFGIRILPLTILRRPIRNKFFQSFLYYVPYVTLAVMTFPAIMDATQSPISGLIALIGGIAMAWIGMDLFKVSVICCMIVLITEYFIC